MCVFKVDAGYYLDGLNGYPGALVKYFVQALTSKDILKLLQGKSREVRTRENLAFCKPGEEPVTFTSELTAHIASELEGIGCSLDRLIIYDGFRHAQAASDYKEVVRYWNAHLTPYRNFATWLVENLGN